MNTAVAVPVGVLAAGTFALASVLQQRAAREAPSSESLSWRLLADLTRRPVWLAGMGCVVVAYGLQSLALAFGPIGLVEPLLAVELVFALPLAAALRHRRLGRREWLGGLLVAAGVATFIVVASPSGGNPEPGLIDWAIVAGPVLAAAAVALASGRLLPETPRRAILLAVSAAMSAAVMALVTQSFVVSLSNAGLADTLVSWQPYALIVLGIATMTVGQSAFQSAPLAVSLPILDSVEPVLATVLAGVAFRQHVVTSSPALTLETIGAVLAIAGIVALARSPLVHSIYEQQQRWKSSEAHEQGATRRAGVGR